MTIAVKMLNDQIKKISETNTLLDMLMEFERFLDDQDIYAYKNWHTGEILEGPIFDRHYVSIKLVYDKKQMPDPAGAERLIGKECLVKYRKSEVESPVKVRSFDDVITEIGEDGMPRHRRKTVKKPVWVVEIKIPRRLVDEFDNDYINADENEYIDMESLNTENLAQLEQQSTGNDDLGVDIGGTI